MQSIQVRQLIALTNEKRGIGFEKIAIAMDNTTIHNLTFPENATYALMVLESENDSSVVARFKLDGNDPSASDGIPLVNLQAFDLSEAHNLGKFRLIGVSGANTYLQVQYFV